MTARMVADLTPLESRVVSLAMGRIFRMGSRETQPGDVAEYTRCRDLVLDIMDGAITDDDLLLLVDDGKEGQ